MIFALDTEFIDTPTASECIRLALVAADGRELYVEFSYSGSELTPWLRQQFVPMLARDKVSFKQAAHPNRECVGGSKFDMPEFPDLVRDFAYTQQDVPNVAGPEHFALNDARSLMSAMKSRGVHEPGARVNRVSGGLRLTPTSRWKFGMVSQIRGDRRCRLIGAFGRAAR